MWYALFIPLVLTIIAYKIWPHKITIGEVIIPTILSALGIWISAAKTCSYTTTHSCGKGCTYTVTHSMKEIAIHDVEYNGHIVVRARYYEYWETWVNYFDCSYCDENAPYWEVYTADGLSFRVDQAYYNKLKQQWSATPVFIELNRSISDHEGIFKGHCGQDGNAYEIRWDSKVETSEGAVTEHPFTNMIKVNHSAFSYKTISKEMADSLGLYSYPNTYSFYKQRCLLSHNMLFTELEHRKLEYLNAVLGPKNKVKIFTLIFKNKPLDIAFKQEQYWEGGNQNELVVCIGVDDAKNIQWVKPFSWCDNKRIIVDTRKDIIESKVLNIDTLFNVYNTNIPKFFHYKSFKDFNYLKFEPTINQLVFIYLLTIILTIGSIWFVVINEIDAEGYYT